jgi:protocatechuate 3,4-dioxygenase beta subunit
MRIIHISDLHFTGGDNDTEVDNLSDIPGSAFSGNWSDVSTWENLATILADPATAVKPWQADSKNRSATLISFLSNSANKAKLNSNLVVITGDLVDSGDDANAYARARTFIQQLQNAGYTVYSVPGNHDYTHWGLLGMASKDYRTAFHQLPGTAPNESYPWCISIGNDKLILLDSMKDEMDAQSYGAACNVILTGSHLWDMPLDPTHIATCLAVDTTGLPANYVSIKSGDQLSQGRLGNDQLTKLTSLLNSLQSARAAGATVAVCMHHRPFPTDSSSQLDDAGPFLNIGNNGCKMDALLCGHATPDGIFWMDGTLGRNNTLPPAPTDWETSNNIPLVSCVNLQHAGPNGFPPATPAYPIVVVDTAQKQLEVYGTDGTGPLVRSGARCVVSGMVTDYQFDQPVVGALVEISTAPDVAPFATATTDSNGNYTLSLASPGTYSIDVSGDPTSVGNLITGWGTFTRNITTKINEPVLRGHVTDAVTRAAIAGAKVSISNFYQPGVPIATATTDGNGFYHAYIPGQQTNWSLVVTVSANNYVFPSVSADVTMTASGATEDLQMTCIAPGIITGKVTDDQGNAVSGAQVTATGGYYPTTVPAKTDANGVYSLSITAGGVNLTVGEAGYQQQSINGITVNSGAKTTENVVLMKLGVPGTVTGRVLAVTSSGDSDVTGATVTCGSVSTTTAATGPSIYTLNNIPSGPATITATYYSATLGQFSGQVSVTVIGHETVTADTIYMRLPPPPCSNNADNPPSCPHAADVPCKAKPDHGGCTGKTPM